VGHLSTEAVLERMTILEFPLKLKFLEFQGSRMTAGRPSIEVGVNQGYTNPINRLSPTSVATTSMESSAGGYNKTNRTVSDSFQRYDSAGEDDTDYDSDKQKGGCMIS